MHYNHGKGLKHRSTADFDHQRRDSLKLFNHAKSKCREGSQRTVGKKGTGVYQPRTNYVGIRTFANYREGKIRCKKVNFYIYVNEFINVLTKSTPQPS